MPATRIVTARASRPRWRGALLAVGLLAVLGGCAGLPQGPTYTDAELKAICERQGGWWRGELISGYCEYQTASISQAP